MDKPPSMLHAAPEQQFPQIQVLQAINYSRIMVLHMYIYIYIYIYL